MPDRARRKLMRSDAVQMADPSVREWLRLMLYRSEQAGSETPAKETAHTGRRNAVRSRRQTRL
jgi:hypothetical protein